MTQQELMQEALKKNTPDELSRKLNLSEQTILDIRDGNHPGYKNTEKILKEFASSGESCDLRDFCMEEPNPAQR